MKILAVCSTSGSLLRELLGVEEIKGHFLKVVCDRQCNALNVAKENGVSHTLIEEEDSERFSDQVEAICREMKIDYVFSFYLKLFKGSFLDTYRNRIINFHPSLLPSFTGFNAIEKAYRYGAKFIGTTIHFVDESTDLGPVILQSCTGLSPDQALEDVTHKLFVHQCKSAIQLVVWLKNGQLTIKDRQVAIHRREPNLATGTGFFSPPLDSPLAINYDKKPAVN